MTKETRTKLEAAAKRIEDASIRFGMLVARGGNVDKAHAGLEAAREAFAAALKGAA